MKKILVSTLLCVSQSILAHDSFISAKAEFADGTIKELNCTSSDIKQNKFREIFQPIMGNQENSYTVECRGQAQEYMSFFFKFDATKKGSSPELTPFVSKTKLTLEKQHNIFTLKFKTPPKQFEIHSFPHLAQHYTSNSKMKINSFSEETEAGLVFHIVSGEGHAEFVDGSMQSNVKNSAGKLDWKFKIKTKYIKSLH